MKSASGRSQAASLCLVFGILLIQALSFAPRSQAGAVASEMVWPSVRKDPGYQIAKNVDTPEVQQPSIRTIEIDMALISFSRKTVKVTAGETVRFVLRNITDQIPHEFTIGTPVMQNGRRALLEDLTESEIFSADEKIGTVFDSPNAVVVMPGETKELIWTFTETQSFEFGCNIPGHYESGMKGDFELSKPGEADTVVSDTAPAPNAEQDPAPEDKLVTGRENANGADLVSEKRWFVQLEVQRRLRTTQARRRFLLRKHRRVLRGRSIRIEVTHKTSGGKSYKLGVGGFRTKRAAMRLCRRIKHRGSKCLVRTAH